VSESPRPEVPRREIPPLPAPEGQLDEVLARARERRNHRAGTTLLVATVFLAGVAGGVALDQPVTNVPVDIIRAAAGQLGDGGESQASAPPADSASASASVMPTERTKKDEAVAPGDVPVSPPAPASSEPAERGALAVVGRAVDLTGAPAAGLYLYPGRKGVDGFVPTERPAGRTAADGSFTLPCTRTPVLLAPWLLNAPADRDARTAAHAATFAGGVTQPGSALAAPCTRRGKPSTTIVQGGSAVAGTVEVAEACGTEPASLRLRLFDDPALTVMVDGLADGDTYRVGGIPSGRHSFGAKGQRTPLVTVGAEVVLRDVTATCGSDPQPQPSPTTGTPPPSTPSPGGTPSPTSSLSPPP
jgi:hypothetical protein